jgi:hypothetical protein
LQQFAAVLLPLPSTVFHTDGNFPRHAMENSGKGTRKAGSSPPSRDPSSADPELRAAIEDLSNGRTAEGFGKLDKFGAIKKIADDADRLAAVAEKQIEAKRLEIVIDHSAHSWRMPGDSPRRAKGDAREVQSMAQTCSAK